MTNMTKLALIVSATISASAFAAGDKGLDVEFYGKIGAAQTSDIDNSLVVDSRLDDTFSAYRDSKVGVIIDHKVNKKVSLHVEGKANYEGQELEFNLQEALINGKYKGFNLEMGRMRTPVFMNSEIQDDDFALHTYSGNTLFSTDSGNVLLSVDFPALETVDGVSLGYKTSKRNAFPSEINFLYGISKDNDVNFYDSTTGKTEEVALRDFEEIMQVELIHNTKFGDFRASYLRAEDESKSWGTISTFGYAYDKGQFFVEGEIALLDNNADIETTMGRGLFGYHIDTVSPYVSYSQAELDGTDETLESLEAGFKYDYNDYINFKTSYEIVDRESDFIADTDEEIISAAISFNFK